MTTGTSLQEKYFNRLQHSLILLTLLLGTYFTKFQVAGPLYLHDAILVLIVMATLLRPRTVYPFPPLVLLLVISGVYLFLSIGLRSTPLPVTLRQYAIFGYCFLFYLLFVKTNSPHSQQAHIRFLKFCGGLSFTIQLGYVLVLLYDGQSIFSDYNYYSPAIAVGLCVAAAAWLARPEDNITRGLGFLVTLLLSATTGHASAFLAVLSVGFCYIFLSVTLKSKILIAAGIVAGIVSLWVLLPQFQDANANWRLIVWNHMLDSAVTERYALFGKGFGTPFFDNNLIQDLYNKLGSTSFFNLENADEPYFSTAHNFFFTLIFTIGLAPAFLILFPFSRGLRYFLRPGASAELEKAFLFSALAGATVWASFNVVLELPHSAGFYWLIYFTAAKSFEESTNPATVEPPVLDPPGDRRSNPQTYESKM